MSASAEPARPALPRGLLVLLGTAALVVTVAGLRGVSDLLGPIFLALVLTIAMAPLTSRLRRRGAPGWVATVAGILGVYTVLVLLAGALTYAIAALAAELPAYADQFDSLVEQGAALLDRLGVDQRQLETALDQLDLSSVVGVLQNVLGQIVGVASDLLLILLVLLFMGMDATGFGARMAALARHRPELATALAGFARGTRRFLWTSSLFGLVTAVLDTLALWAIGVPLPAVWGLLAFITNYIPNIGFVIGLVPPALLGLLEGGPVTMLAVVAVYLVVNFVVESVVQPKIVGDAVGLGATVTLLALVFWGWLIGALGALLAVPLTLLAKALLVDADPDRRWITVLISASPPPPEDPVADEPLSRHNELS